MKHDLVVMYILILQASTLNNLDHQLFRGLNSVSNFL